MTGCNIIISLRTRTDTDLKFQCYLTQAMDESKCKLGTYRWVRRCNDGRWMVLSCVMVGSVVGVCCSAVWLPRVVCVAKDSLNLFHANNRNGCTKLCFKWSCKSIQNIKHSTLLTTWDLSFSTAMLLSSPLGCEALSLSEQLLTFQMTTWPWRRKYNPPKSQELHTKWHRVTYQQSLLHFSYHHSRTSMCKKTSNKVWANMWQFPVSWPIHFSVDNTLKH
jgi:hypothetical protein